MGENANSRNSSFELMRIVAMFMIVIGHCVMATAQDQGPYLGTIDNIGWFIKAFTVCAVNLFFLLTGYFAQGNRIRFGKTIELWIKTIIYSAGIYIISCIIGNVFERKILIKYMLPITFKTYWYMQVWVVLSLVAPFIAKVLDNVDEKAHFVLILILVFFFSLHQTFIPVSSTLDQTQGYGIIWAIVMLVIGSWIHKYAESYIKKIPAVVFLVGYILSSLTIFASNYLIVKFDIAQGVTSRGNFYAYNSLTVLVQSLCLFAYFARKAYDFHNIKLVNAISINIIAAYLITAHPVLLYPLWDNILNMRAYWTMPAFYVILAVLFTVVAILICVITDKVLDFILYKLSIKTRLGNMDYHI